MQKLIFKIIFNSLIVIGLGLLLYGIFSGIILKTILTLFLFGIPGTILVIIGVLSLEELDIVIEYWNNLKLKKK